MLSSDQQEQIQQLLDIFRHDGSSYLQALEQICVLIYLEELYNANPSNTSLGHGGQLPLMGDDRFSWEAIVRERNPFRKNDLVRDAISTAFHLVPRVHSLMNMFEQLSIANTPRSHIALSQAIDLIDKLFATQPVNKGEIFESILSITSAKSKSGLFMTPRHIIREMVNLVAPAQGERVCDPVAGTAGFLVEAYKQVVGNNIDTRREELSKYFTAFDINSTAARIGGLNMLLHGITQPKYLHQDALSLPMSEFRSHDVILANPPFGMRLDADVSHVEWLPIASSNSDVFYIQLCAALLSHNGRCALVVPDGLLFRSSNAYLAVRKWLLENYNLHAVISLPAGAFEPLTGIKTSILYFSRQGVTERVWFYDAVGDGYTLDWRRNSKPENNDLQFVSKMYREAVLEQKVSWESNDDRNLAQSRQWMVSREEITLQDYSLIGRAYKPLADVDDPSRDPQDVLSELLAVEQEINQRLEHINSLLTRRQEIDGSS